VIEPRWLTKAEILRLHDIQIREFGGPAGVRDEGLLESALARPQQLYHYGGVNDIVSLAVAYAAGISRNHAFIDGNKRTAFYAMIVFLDLHGFELAARQDEAAEKMLAFAAGTLGEEELQQWVRTRL
jgi:death on curing protein